MEVVYDSRLPMAVGPYSYGTKYGNLIVTSGQIAIDSDTNEVVTDIYKATKMVLESLLLVVENCGGSKNTIMKADVFLKDLKDFNVFNQAYSEFFGNHKPARVTVQAGDLAEGATIEIAVMAYAKE